MTGILLDVDELKGYIQDTAESTTTLQQRIDDIESEINDRFGPLALTADSPPAIAKVTERIWIRGYASAITVRQDVDGQIVSIKADGATTALAASAYQLRGRELVLAGGGPWAYGYIDVEYKPRDTRPARRRALIKLIQLDMNYQPGMGGSSAGPWAESYTGQWAYADQREAIFQTIDEPDLFA